MAAAQDIKGNRAKKIDEESKKNLAKLTPEEKAIVESKPSTFSYAKYLGDSPVFDIDDIKYSSSEDHKAVLARAGFDEKRVLNVIKDIPEGKSINEYGDNIIKPKNLTGDGMYTFLLENILKRRIQVMLKIDDNGRVSYIREKDEDNHILYTLVNGVIKNVHTIGIKGKLSSNTLGYNIGYNIGVWDYLGVVYNSDDKLVDYDFMIDNSSFGMRISTIDWEYYEPNNMYIVGKDSDENPIIVTFHLPYDTDATIEEYRKYQAMIAKDAEKYLPNDLMSNIQSY